MLQKDEKGPAVKLPPAVALAAFALLAGLAEYCWPMPLADLLGLRILGGLVFLCGLSLVFMVQRSFNKVNTHIKPWKPTSSIVSTGVFAYSRNPVYVGFCLMLIGLGLLVVSGWLLLSFIPLAVILHFFVINKEEAYLELKFDQQYLSYKNTVRRWL